MRTKMFQAVRRSRFLSLILAGALFAPASVAQFSSVFPVRVEVTTPGGSPIPGQIVFNNGSGVPLGTPLAAPQTVQVSEGEALSLGLLVDGYFERSDLVPGVRDGHLYTIDAATGQLTSTRPGGLAVVRYLVDHVTVDVEVTDTAGNDLPGQLTFLNGSNAPIGEPIGGPHPVTLVVGATLVVRFVVDLGVSYEFLDTSVGPVFPGHLYEVDFMTGGITTTETPGSTKVVARFPTAPDNQLTASDGGANDRFGGSVALAGDLAVVGAAGELATYVFRLVDGSWQEEATLRPPGSSGAFGYSVAIEHETIVVGDIGDNGNTGAVYVYDYDGQAWIPAPKLTADDGEFGDLFGWDVDISRGTIVVGAKDDDNEHGSFVGGAYVFRKEEGIWTQQGPRLAAGDPVPGDQFGESVAISGDTLVVSSIRKDAGVVYVFRESSVGWAQEERIAPGDGFAGDNFGHVALNGDLLVVGSTRDDGRSGSVYTYERIADTWTAWAKLKPDDGASHDHFGAGISLSGDLLVVGARQDDDNGDNSGSVYVFENIGGTWRTIEKLTASDGAAGDLFGTVEITGRTVIVGSSFDDPLGQDSGSAYIFDVSLDAVRFGTPPAEISLGITQTVGWQFTVAAPVDVTAFGWYDNLSDGLVDPHQVGIFDEARNLLGVASVNSMSDAIDSFRFTDLPGGQTINLTPGQVYTIAGTHPGSTSTSGGGSGDIFARDGAAKNSILVDPMFQYLGSVSEDTNSNPVPTGLVFPDEVGPAAKTFRLGPTFRYKVASAVLPEPTPPGTDVVVEPVDTATGESPLALQFDDVVASGTTTVTSTPVESDDELLEIFTNPPPSSFGLLGTPTVIYDIDTTASFTGEIQICIDFSGTDPLGTPTLFHIVDGAWIDITDEAASDLENNIICGTTTSLSPFMVLALLDSEQPIVGITSPSDGEVIGAATVTVSASIADESETTVELSPGGLIFTLPEGGGSVDGVVGLVEGPNTLTVNATDSGGNAAGSAVEVIRDTIAPSVAVPSPTEGEVLGSSPATVNVDVVDATGTSVDFLGVSGAVPAGGGSFSGDANLIEGPNAIVVSVTDQGGNASELTRNVVLDVTAPIVEITAPANGSTFGPGETSVWVSATVGDLTATTLSSAPPGVEGSLPAGGGTAAGTVALDEGSNTILVNATDASGKTGSHSVTVVLDTTGPEVSLAAPADGDAVRGVVDVVVVATDPLPGSGVARVDLELDGQPVGSLTSSPFETVLDTSGISDGPHSLKAVAFDGEGNFAPAVIQMTVDNTPPAISIADPADGSFVMGTIGFSVTASDAVSGLQSVTMLAGGGAPTGDDSVIFPLPVGSTTRFGSEDTTGQGDGPLLLSASAVDAAGNEALATVTVIADNTLPEKSLISPLDGSTVSGVMMIEAAATDANLASIEIRLDGNSLGSSSASPFQIDVDTKLFLDGEMLVESIVTDLAGNQSLCQATVTVDNLSVDLDPDTLNLRSKGGANSVTLTVEGVNAGLLAGALIDHEVVVLVPGGNAITASFQNLGDLDGDSIPDLTLKMDRQELIQSIQAGIAAELILPNSVVELAVLTQSNIVKKTYVIGTVRTRILGGGL